MLHIIYRSYGGENTKDRPAYYSKLLSMLSLVRAVEEYEGRAEIIWLNDGPMPQHRLSVMERSGEVVPRLKLGNKGSLRAALAMPEARGWGQDDLVWLAEDDYLYLPTAMNGLRGATQAFPEASYFGLYASIGSRPPEGGTQPEYAPVPSGWHDSEPVLVHGSPWRRALSTCATFGARAGVLNEDRKLFHAALWTGAGWDQTMCLLYQGFLPFNLSLMTEHVRRARGPWLRSRGVAIGTLRAVLSAYQAARIQRGAPARLLVAPEPSLATHLELNHLARGTDWGRVAEDTRRWALERNFAADSPQLAQPFVA
jgi:hypothetical protein